VAELSNEPCLGNDLFAVLRLFSREMFGLGPSIHHVKIRQEEDATGSTFALVGILHRFGQPRVTVYLGTAEVTVLSLEGFLQISLAEHLSGDSLWKFKLGKRHWNRSKI
jgi:hypothetical protein